MSRTLTLLCLLIALIGPAASVAGERLALVIGNAGYRNVPALANPGNDARLIADTLRAAGFRVTRILDADRATMIRAVERFGREVRAARPGALALFYFAGHGVRSAGFNHLLPIGVEIRAEADIAREAIAAEWVLARIEAPHVTDVMVLDACRDNPFDDRGPRTIPELGDGLARMTAREGNLIAYATGPGDVALDGTGRNSPYAAALARAMGRPGLDLEGIFAQVRREVAAETEGVQIPWESSSLRASVHVRARLPEDPAPGRPGDPAPMLHLAVSFGTGRWDGADIGSCRTLYRYAPVRLRAAPGQVRRVETRDGNGGVALELAVGQGEAGEALSIVPVSGGASGRPVRVPIAEISPGRERLIHTQSRHPELFGCGMMTLHVRRGG